MLCLIRTTFCFSTPLNGELYFQVGQYNRAGKGVVGYLHRNERMWADNARKKIQRQTIEIESSMRSYYCSSHIIKI